MATVAQQQRPLPRASSHSNNGGFAGEAHLSSRFREGEATLRSNDLPMAKFCHPRLQAMVAVAWILATVVVMSISGGGWDIRFSFGTSGGCPAEHHHHEDGDDLFDAVCLGGATEYAFSGVLDKHYVENGTGVYRCACCGTPLFPASTKFNSRSGWPSYWAPVYPDPIGYSKDKYSVEVHCGTCGAHLGHVFDDGVGSTGYRYCINSVCLWYDDSLTMDVDTNVPWVPNMYLLLLLLGGAILSCCFVCMHSRSASAGLLGAIRKWTSSRVETQVTEVSLEEATAPERTEM